MDSLFYYFFVVILGFLLLVSWGLTVMGFPGNWLMILSAGLFTFFFPEQGGHGITWKTVGILAGLAVLGEGLELVSGAAGVAKGGSKRGAVFALMGSFLGSALGVFVSLPVPLIGPVVGVVVGAAVGAMIGTVIGEQSGGKSVPESYRLGKVAFWGRLAGTVSKIGIGSIIAAVAFFAALL